LTVSLSKVDPVTDSDAIVETPVAFKLTILALAIVPTPVTFKSVVSTLETSMSPALISTVAIVDTPDTFKLVVSISAYVLIPVTTTPSVNDVSPSNVGIVAIPVMVIFLPVISSYEISAKVVNPVTLS
jgi:hypothetical protein